MRLFIAEKPSLGKAIAERLGPVKKTRSHIVTRDGSVVTWCFGHMLEIPSPDFFLMGRKLKRGEKAPFWKAENLPIIPSNWTLHEKKGVKEQLVEIKKLLKKATTVVNTGDPDREGQLLVDELLEYYNFKGKVERIWLSALDDASIDKELKNIHSNDKYVGLKNAALARSRADWLLGLNLTRAFTVSHFKSGGSGLVPIGRVQTPTLSLVASIQKKIERFVPVPFYVPVIHCRHENGKYVANLVINKDIRTDSEGRIVDRSVAEAILGAISQASTGTIHASASKKGKENPPLPFSLSALQIASSKDFGYSADDVLNTAQALYETHKIATYPRTDCGNLPESMFAEAPSVLASVKGAFPQWVAGANTSIRSAAWNDKKVTAHHGIIPTGAKVNMSKLNEMEKNIFTLIVRNYVAQFYPPFEFEATAIITRVNGYNFRSTGKVPLNQGWKKIIQVTTKSSENNQLPKTNKGDTVAIEKADIENKKTSPPKPFTDGTLIEAMAKVYKYVDDERAANILKGCKGIGTEATRASIIKSLLDRGLLKKKGKQIVVTDRGMALYEILPDPLKTPVTTAAWEAKIEMIEANQFDLDKFIDEMIESMVKPLCESALNSNFTLPAQENAPKKRGGYKKRTYRKKKTD